MREIIDQLAGWRRDGQDFAVATVVGTWSSSPRQPGASMAVDAAGVVVGSVSGGCVEGAVYEVCQEVMATRVPRLVRYGVSDDDAFAVGLTCGGIIDIYVRPADDALLHAVEAISAALAERRPIALATLVAGASGPPLVIEEDRVTGSWDDEHLQHATVSGARGLLEHGTSAIIRLGPHGERQQDEVSVFVDSYAAPPRMLVFGAIDFAASVARIGKFLGFHVTVCDARPIFATRARFAEADEVVVDWPHRYLDQVALDRRSVVCVLTHDPKFDIPVLVRALQSPAGYIGAMGSRRTHDDRVRRLRAEGVDDDALSRLRSPIGLDLGARTPEETAVAIAAEIVAHTWGGSTQSLSRTTGDIHRHRPTSALAGGHPAPASPSVTTP